MVKETIFNTDIPTFREILTKSFEYKIVIQGKKFPPERYDKFDYYHSLSPEEFHRYRAGICWDFVAYENYVFTKSWPYVKYKLYYIEGEIGRTHTFLIYWNDKNRPVLFEAVNAGYRGCFEFKTEKEVLKFMASKFFQYKPEKNWFIVEYKQPDEYGLTAREFMDYVVTTGKLRMQKGLYYDEVK